MSLGKTTKSNLVAISMLSVVDKLTSFVLVLLIARRLGAETYGEYSFAFALSCIFTALSDLGINTLITRDLAKDRDREKAYISQALGIKMCSSIAILSIIVALNLTVPVFKESATVIFLVMLTSLVRAVSGALTAVARARLQMKFEARAGIVNRSLALLGGVVVLVLGYGLIALLWIFVFASLVELAYIAKVVSSRFTPFTVRFDFSEQKKLILAGLPFLLVTSLTMLNYRLDSIILRFIQGKEATGIYNVAYILILNLIMVQQIAGRVLLPVFSRFGEESRQRFQKYCCQAIKVLVVVALLAILAVQGFGDRIILTLYGAQYSAATTCLKVLIFSVVFMFISHISSTALIALNNEKQVVKAWTFALVSNVILNLALIPKFSYIGASAATVFSEILLCSMSYYYLVVKNRYPLLQKVEWFKLVAPFVAGLVFLSIVDHISMVFSIPLLLLLYSSLLILGRAFSREDLEDFVRFIRL